MTLGNTDGHGTMDSFRKKKIWRLLRGGFFFGPWGCGRGISLPF